MLNSSLSFLLLCVVLVSEKAGMVEPSFPKGLRVLAVDDDKAFLLMLEKMLLACMYQVTICDGGEDALSIIRGDKNRFDLILCDLYMPNMDGLELLRNIASETDIPVVMMSHDGTPEAVMKSVVYGACDFLVKPISIEQIGVVWHHVLRRRQNNQSENVREREPVELDKPKPVEDEEEEEHHHEHEHGTNKAKKPRIIWTQELHQKFIQAVNQLGVDKAVPKKILECMQQMGVTELTRENVASHLQKFRLYVRRRNGESIEHSGNSSMFVGPSGLEQVQVQVQGHPFQYGNNNIAMPLHEQRKLVDPMMTPPHYHHHHHHHHGFGANNMATLPRPMHHVFPQSKELTSHDHHLNYDQVYALNGNLFPPLTKHEGLGGGGGGVILHHTDSDPQVHLYAYDQDNPSFNQALP